MRHWSSPVTAEKVLAYLHRHANDDGEVESSLALLADALNLGSITIHRALRRLADNHAIEVIRRGSGPGYLTRYRLLRAPKVERPAPVAGARRTSAA